MARFLIEAHGERFEVDAPDQATALAAFGQMAEMPELAAEAPQKLTGTTRRSDYNNALRKVRETQFPNMSDEAWAEYSARAFPPQDFQGVAQSAQMLGFGDEMGAGIGAFGSQVKNWLGDESSPDFGTAYADYEALERARRDFGRQEMGDGMALAADVVGGISSFGVGAAPAVAPSLLRTAATTAGEGAAVGAATGFGTADEDRLSSAALGGALGFGVGAALPVAGAGVGAGYRNVANALTRGRAARQTGMSPQAAQMLQETMAADDALGPAGLANMAAAGPDAMLADAGPSAQNALDLAIQSSGRAGRVARDAIQARAARGAVSIQDALDVALGAPQGVETTRAGIRAGSAQPRHQAYDAAYAQPVGYDTGAGRQIEDMLRRVPQEALRRAQRLMHIRGEQSAENFISIAPDGTATLTHPPDVRELDYIIRGLNDEADNGIGMGAMGGQTDVGSSLSDLARDLRTTLRNQVPEYDAALNVAADTIRQSQAVQRGSELLRAGTTREAVADWTRGMTAAERAAMAQGIRSGIDDTLANVRRAITDGNMDVREAVAAVKQLSSRANREKVTHAIGNQPAQALFNELDRVARSFELQASVSTNTRTFQRQEMNRRVGDFADPDTAIEAALKGEPVNAGKRVIQAITGRTPARTLRRKDQINEEIARALTAPSGQAISTIQALQRLQGGTQHNDNIAAIIAALLGRPALPAAGLSGQLSAGLQRHQ